MGAKFWVFSGVMFVFVRGPGDYGSRSLSFPLLPSRALDLMQLHRDSVMPMIISQSSSS